MRVGIRQKLLLMSGAVLLLPGLFFVYTTTKISTTEGIAIAKEQAIARHLRATSAATSEFSNLRYWLTNLSVTWLNESEDNADLAAKQLQINLETLAIDSPELLTRIEPKIAEYREKMILAVDAYVDENRVLGNSLVNGAILLADNIESQLNELRKLDEKMAEATLRELAEHNESIVTTAFAGLGIVMMIGFAIS